VLASVLLGASTLQSYALGTDEQARTHWKQRIAGIGRSGWAQAGAFVFGTVLIFATWWADLVSARAAQEDAESKQDAARKHVTERTGEAKADLLESDEVSRKLIERKWDECISAFRSNQTYEEFYLSRTPSEQKQMQLPDCGILPPWRQGNAEIRFGAWPTPELAERSRSDVRQLLAAADKNDWLAHVYPGVVESHASHQSNRKLWVATVTKAELGYEKRFCEWLECKGVDFGEEPCGTRDVHGTREKNSAR
jgi:hypothetical protein